MSDNPQRSPSQAHDAVNPTRSLIDILTGATPVFTANHNAASPTQQAEPSPPVSPQDGSDGAAECAAQQKATGCEL